MLEGIERGEHFQMFFKKNLSLGKFSKQKNPNSCKDHSVLLHVDWDVNERFCHWPGNNQTLC